MQGHNDEKALAGLGREARLTTFALAVLIFGIAGVSALWLLVIAGLAALWSLLIALIVRFLRSLVTHSCRLKEIARR
jgi:hypothetical protein